MLDWNCMAFLTELEASLSFRTHGWDGRVAKSSSQTVVICVCVVCLYMIYILSLRTYDYVGLVCVCLACNSLFARVWVCLCLGLVWTLNVFFLNSVFQNVCCSLDHTQLVFLYTIRSECRHFSTFHRGFQLLGDLSFVVSTGCVHVMSLVEGWRRVVMKQSQLQGLVWCVWAQTDAWPD